MGRYDNVPISDETRKGMTLNIDDLAAIGRLLSLQDLEYEDRFAELASYAKRQDIVQRDILDQITAINERIDKIEHRLKSDDDRIKALEQYASFWSTALRIAIGSLITLLAAMGIHSWITKS